MLKYLVLLYPPHGIPRVEEMDVPKGMRLHMQTFKTRKAAERALEKYYNEFPEHRTWKDGCTHPELQAVS